MPTPEFVPSIAHADTLSLPPDVGLYGVAAMLIVVLMVCFPSRHWRHVTLSLNLGPFRFRFGAKG